MTDNFALMNRLFFILAVMLFGACVGLLTVNLFAFDLLIQFLEQNVSSDQNVTESGRELASLRLYQAAALCAVFSVLCYKCAKKAVRTKAKSFIWYDPTCDVAPRPQQVFRALTTIVIVLIPLSVAEQYALLLHRDGEINLGLHANGYFNFDGEQLVPTWFSTALLLYSSLLLGLIATHKLKVSGRYTPHWGLLAVIFAYLALDERVQIHESGLDFLIPIVGINFIHFWVLPASLLVALFVVLYSGFLMHLSNKYRRLFLLSGSIYVIGALGFEALGGLYAESHGKANMPYFLIANVEEVCEMMGIVLFIYTLQTYIVDMKRELRDPAVNDAASS
jgi:hypothetical protein